MNRQQRRRASRNPFRPAAQSQPGRTNYDNIAPEMRRDYVIGLEQTSEKIAAELNATRLALAVLLERGGGEVMIGEADVQRVDGRRIKSDQVDLPAGAWVFKLTDKADDA